MPSATWASWWESAGWWNFHGKCCVPFHLFYVLCLDNVVQVDINVYIFQYPNRESCNVPAKRHNMMAYGR